MKKTLVTISVICLAIGVACGLYLGGFFGAPSAEEIAEDASAFASTTLGGTSSSDWHLVSSEDVYFPEQLLSDKALEKVIGVAVPKYRIQSRQERQAKSGHYYLVEAVPNFKLTKIFINDLKKHCSKFEQTDSVPTYYFLDCPVQEDPNCTKMDVTIRCEHGSHYMQIACLPKQD